MGTKLRLVVMNFLQYAIWGAYLTSMGSYLVGVDLASHIGIFYAMQGIVSLFMPAVIGIVARLLCPNTVEEVPEEPKSTGNAELDKMIDDGRKAIAEMKRLDDNIADPTISAQIVRLQELSGKIFAQVEQNPEKLPQIRRFMNYYLPTTLKILNAYDRMGEQGVAGENITSTMHKVESMMATIITAFEKQLDNLFGAEAMDISTDMVVLENMMAREGLTDDPLHRTAAASAEDTPEDGGITLEL